jgi:hypothetical protein
MLILPLPLEAFDHRRRNGDPVFPLGRERELLILYAGSVVEKPPKSMAQISIAGVLRLRALNPSVCDGSAKRFAQDDGFVGG